MCRRPWCKSCNCTCKISPPRYISFSCASLGARLGTSAHPGRRSSAAHMRRPFPGSHSAAVRLGKKVRVAASLASSGCRAKRGEDARKSRAPCSAPGLRRRQVRPCTRWRAAGRTRLGEAICPALALVPAPAARIPHPYIQGRVRGAGMRSEQRFRTSSGTLDSLNAL